MLKFAVVLAIVVLAGTIYMFTRMPKDLRDRQLDASATVDIEGVATAELPPTFKCAGVVNSGARGWKGGTLTDLEHHLDDTKVTFRFKQGAFSTSGGYAADPVILDITVYSEAVASAAIASVTSTSIDRFYGETDIVRFEQAPWQGDVAEGSVRIRIAPWTDVYSGPKERWLVILVDSSRRVRVDLYAWRKAYALDEAQTLVRQVAARASVRVLRYLGSVPLAAAKANARARIEFPLVARYLLPGVKNFDGVPELGIAVMSFSEADNRWLFDGLQNGIYEDEDRDSALTKGAADRLTDRSRAYLFRWPRYDAMFNGDRVEIDAFVTLSDILERDLAQGKLLAGSM